MGDAAAVRKLSPAEYLAFERSSETKHEYADGEIFAMSGGTFAHSAIAANIGRLLGTALEERGCTTLTSDMRIHVPATGRYVYPDGSIVCGPPSFQDEQQDTLLNPVVIVEVLSDSTEAYDRGDKFAGYQSIPSLRHYVIASQKVARIEVFTRQSDGSWILRNYGPGEHAELSAAGCAIDVDRVYRSVFTP